VQTLCYSMKQLNMIDDLGWLLSNYKPKEVIVHSNSSNDWDKFDRDHLERMGYKKGQTVTYRLKQGKNTLLSNPFMMEGL